MSPNPAQHEMMQIGMALRRYFEARLRREALTVLNETIRHLRILLQETVSNHFLLLPLVKAREFRFALGDQLYSICGELKKGCSVEDDCHHEYCVKGILACFEWAEQIKEEIPDDPVTQKILAIDIPILRPFDYGFGKKKSR